MWEVGGPVGDLALDLAGCFFLGPPLPNEGLLLVMAERQMTIELLAIDPARQGKLVWSIKLAQSDAGIERNRPQRLRGLSPSAAEGLAICPTGTGLLVAVDVSRRSLAWAASCADVVNPARKGPRQNPARQQASHHGEGEMLPLIARGRVLATSPDRRRIVCLRLMDGSHVWNTRETGTTQILAASSEAVFVREGKQISARRLSEGSDFWTRSVEIPGLAGLGVLLEDFLLLPLTSGEVLSIDVKTGREASRWKYPEGQRPGNLVWTGDRLLSQSETSIEVLPGEALPTLPQASKE